MGFCRSVAIWALLACAPAVAAASPQKASPSCAEGDRALAARDFALAQGNYQKCLEEGTPSFETLSNLGIVHAQLGQFEQAIKAYQQALALTPANPPVLMNLGLAYLKMGRHAEAAAEFARSLLSDPGNAKTEELLAFCHFQMKEYALAALEAERVHKALPDDPSAAFLLGSAYLKLDLYSQAIPLIDFALRKINSGETHMILGEAYLGVKAYKEALAEFLRAEKLSPNMPGLHADLGTAFSGIGDADRAKEEYRKELATNPTNFEANYFLGRLQRLSGDLVEARKLLVKAAELRPGDPSVQYEFAVFAMKDKDYAKAKELLEAVLAKYPSYTDGHVLLAEVYFRMHRPEEGKREKAVVDALKKAEQERQSAGSGGQASGGSSHPGSKNPQ